MYTRRHNKISLEEFYCNNNFYPADSYVLRYDATVECLTKSIDEES